MAASKGRSTSKRSGSKRTAASKSTGTQRKSSGAKRNNSGRSRQAQQDLTPEILLFAIILVLLVISLCTIGIVGGAAGEGIRRIVLGIFGTAGYLIPPVLIIFAIFGGNFPDTLRFKISAVLLIFIVGMLSAYFGGNDLEALSVMEEGRAAALYENAKGGGILFGFPALWIYGIFEGKVLPILLLILIAIFCILTLFDLSFFGTIRAIVERVGDTAEELREVPRRYAPDEEELAARKERRSARMREYEDTKEIRAKQREEAAIRREEEELKREQQRQLDDERRAEAARARAEKEEQARLAFEEKKAKREEERQRRKEAEERAEDDRILSASRPVVSKAPIPPQPNFVSASLNERPHTSPDEIHEITLPRLAGAMKPVLSGVSEALSAESVSAVSEGIGSASELSDTKRFRVDAPEAEDDLPPEAMDFGRSNVTPDEYDAEQDDGSADTGYSDVETNCEDTATDGAETTAADNTENVLLQNMPKPVTERSHSTANADVTENTVTADEDAGNTTEPVKVTEAKAGSDGTKTAAAFAAKPAAKKPAKPAKYECPPISLLNQNVKKKSGDSDRYLQEIAAQLKQTLQSFGVTAEVIGISQGPSVTRFELQPAEGTKVNKIVGLADDLKLALAAQDIRIEAPIPGKAAVGIEIPNKETSSVFIRDLIESAEFKSANSKISYAVGKDISGQVIVSDIAKMPHLLVAGATGSGKSVFINTLIMSILYEASPEEVKLIMVDPKFVELSVYNGIPHLLLPVVTDPRQANAALAWAVAEMTRRYRLFETNKVRGLPAYNELVDAGKATDESGEAKRLYQLVVIVDELADLMMVASKEVEESICRLAQLARAAGIHLVIATQRPSVNVITGLIKANMPSRIAFKVSSGIDSRTILDMVGAERLLGNGDMLFAPQNLNKPLRVQGAFVSDAEVTKVVDFLKKNAGDDVYDETIVSSINDMSKGEEAEPSEKVSRGNSGTYDSMFDEVARYVVEKEKASSTMLQRVFKISYNRAVRIIDQLEESGVIGAEAGTKPRNVLMNMAQLEEFLLDRKEDA